MGEMWDDSTCSGGRRGRLARWSARALVGRNRHREDGRDADRRAATAGGRRAPAAAPGACRARGDPGCATGGEREWGDTGGQAAFVDRSAFGVTATGEEVYAAGPVLADAGVVRGMELDINPAWVDGARFTPSATGASVGRPVYPAERTPPTHYLSASSRDRFSWTLRRR